MRNILFLVLFSVIFISCNDNPTKTTHVDKNEFFPMKIGNYWIYKSYNVDASATIIDSTITIDSMVVTSSKLYENRTAFVLSYFKNNSLAKDYLFSSDIYGLYRISDSLSESIPDLKPTWFKIFDYLQKTWNIYGNYISDVPFEFNNYQTTVIKHWAINGNRNTDANPSTIDGKSVSAYFANYLADRRFSFKYFEAGYPAKANVEIIELHKEYFWLADNVGIVQWQFEPFNITTRSDSTFCIYKDKPTIEKFGGWKRELLRYKIQ